MKTTQLIKNHTIHSKLYHMRRKSLFFDRDLNVCETMKDKLALPDQHTAFHAAGSRRRYQPMNPVEGTY